MTSTSLLPLMSHPSIPTPFPAAGDIGNSRPRSRTSGLTENVPGTSPPLLFPFLASPCSTWTYFDTLSRVEENMPFLPVCDCANWMYPPVHLTSTTVDVVCEASPDLLHISHHLPPRTTHTYTPSLYTAHSTLSTPLMRSTLHTILPFPDPPVCTSLF
jgi:hypothetical protein